jgi:uncharacterized protein (TIGR02145 family)
MKNIILVGFLLIFRFSFSQQIGTFTDSRDGKVYKTVVIGTQTWMAENLNVSTFRNGDSIPQAKTNEEWIKANKEGKPAWCYYENTYKKGLKYGKIYNEYAMRDKRGLAPEGWHIPLYSEWSILSKSSSIVALKSTTGWINCIGDPENYKGNNKSGFNALPSGTRGYKGEFIGDGSFIMFWASDGYFDSTLGMPRNEGISIGCKYNKYYLYIGCYIRCIKD